MELKPLITKLIQSLGLVPEKISLLENDESTRISLTLSSADSGALIGYHGETIEALQTIVGLMVNHNKTQYRPVEVDVNGYRLKREQSLIELADKAAESALQSGREIILPPLSPRERRLIHLHLSTNQTVTTYSEGEGSSRRLVVRPSSPQD